MSSKQRECRHNFNRIQIDPKQFIVMKTNSILEDYIIDKEIGKGGYGIVYRGTDKVQKEPRAIKKIFKDKMSVDLKLSLIN
jgi:serine/threonine protein kinase